MFKEQYKNVEDDYYTYTLRNELHPNEPSPLYESNPLKGRYMVAKFRLDEEVVDNSFLNEIIIKFTDSPQNQ